MGAVTTRAPLYSVTGMVIAAVLGSFAAAVVLMVLNYQALGAPALVRRISIIGLVIYLVLMGLMSLVPEQLQLLVVPPTQALVAWALGNTLQGEAIRYHVGQGGALHSNFRAAGIALLVAMALLALLVIGAMLFGTPGITPPPPAP